MASENQFQLVPVEDITALGEALAKLLNDRDLRERLAASARVRAASEFNLDRHTTRIEQVLCQALHDVRSPGVKQVVTEIQTPELQDWA